MPKKTVEEDSLNNIVEQFGLKMIDCCNCRRIWRVKTDLGFKYLKKTKLSAADLWFVHEALQYLHRNSFPHTPTLLCSKTGEPFVNTDNGIFILTDWFFGVELDFGTLMDLRAASRFLAEFHQKSSGFFPSQPNESRTCWLKWPVKLENRLTELQDFFRLANAEKESSHFSRLYLRNFEPFYRQAVTSYEALLKSPYRTIAEDGLRQRSFCHHDYSGRNLLRTYLNCIFLVDFDYCLLDLRIHDLINLLVRNLKHNGWNPDIGDFILNEYQQVIKLTQEELEVMSILLSWPQDFWQVGLQYYYEKLPWSKERFLRKLEHKIDCRLARNKFLDEFNKRIYKNQIPRPLKG